MTQDPALRLSSILMTAAGFSALALTGELPAGLVVLGAAALLLSLTQVARPGSRPAGGAADGGPLFRLPRRAWNTLLIAAFAGFVADLLWISQDLLPAGIHFLVLLMVNKLFTLQQRKDFLHLYAISLLELLSAAALTVELWYGAVFVAYLLATIWTLLLYHLRNETEEVQKARAAAGQPAGAVHEPGPISSRFFWTTNAIALGAFSLTLVIFFLTPRIGTGFFNKNRVEQIRTSGFSEQVDLGTMGAVKLDPTVVMRVEFPDRQSPFAVADRLYFRGAAFDVYNGRSWSRSSAHRRVVPRTDDGTFLVDDAAGGTEQGLRQEILLEALDTAVLFGASFVVSVKGAFQVLQADDLGGLLLPFSPGSRFQYSLRSRSDRILEEERREAVLRYPDDVVAQYLQLPPMEARVTALAQEVTRQAATPYERSLALESHLRTAYRYSLDVGAAPPAHPVEEFLFTRKTGYCEHYATAMVIMLRGLGIPARLVTGFLPGEWNGFGNYYTVRQRDAHAWVEVYFPKSGWVTFDPTPAVTDTASEAPWAGLVRMADSIQLKWDRFIIQYSFRDQVKAARNIRDRGEKVRGQAQGLAMAVAQWARRWRDELVAEWGRPDRLWSLGLAGVILFPAAGLALWLWQRLRPRRATSAAATRQAAAVKVYGRMLELLEARGLRKAPCDTASEFARQVTRAWTEAEPFVAPLTELYCRVRFGQAPLSVEDLRLAEQWLAGLDAAARRSP